MSNIVVLNSGGFDSVCLAHKVREEHPEADIYYLFFDYGQRAVEYERECSCKSSGNNFTEIKVKIPWSKSSIVGGNENLYVEMRNMIFLSYAISYAESIRAEEIYVAFTKPQGYPDTSFEFLRSINDISKKLGIEVIAPFHESEKEDLSLLARRYGIEKEDFCSCFHTENAGEKCNNCLIIDELYENYIEPYRMDDLFNQGRILELKELIVTHPITRAKFFINSICNMHCPYCLVDNGDFYKKDSIDSLFRVMDKLHDLNIREVDFCGKEPLFDRTVFDLMEYCEQKYPEFFDFSMLTNGKNAVSYLPLLKEHLKEISISYDITGGRPYNIPVSDLLDIIESGIKVNISLDVHKKNLGYVVSALREFDIMGVKSVYMKPIVAFSNMPNEEFVLSDMELLNLIMETGLEQFKTDVTFSLPPQKRRLSLLLSKYMTDDFSRIGSVFISGDNYCISGYDTVFIESDGTVSGCGYETFNKCSVSTNIIDIKTSEELKEKITTKNKNNCSIPIDKN